ncbi:hypothetical protein D0T49_00155 [Paludibacter sp. 221]|uniref:hypothetical protein n=1 Tax=Paludibacter sp. 221 TaxID=2302939 RepID=UPI0013D46940|nr:hypothetical protein [Paludibacter sp. 221]NDV45464.1 hypothetical protein [Paludibacter sp. 221]
MGFFLVILIGVGAFIAFKFLKGNDTPYVKERIKGRPENQKKVIRYFCNDDGCFSSRMKDEEYDGMVRSVLNSMDFRQKALNKIGLDEDQVKEIDPVHFENYLFGKKHFARFGKDHKWRSSAYQVSWLFFSDTQVYLYQYTFNMDEDGKQEKTEEYFYKDITNFSASSDTEESPVYDPKQKKEILKNIDSCRFAITVPGDKLWCAMDQNDYTERAIQAMKAKLREKKNS